MQRKAVGVLLFAVALAFIGQSVWMEAKARLAQVLLARAWQERVAGTPEPKPWPWADTWPVALLRAPRLGAQQIVLAGASGRNMAFGPTHLSSSARPGSDTNVVLSGHRDTHFAFLEHLELGDEIVIETPDEREHRYAVTGLAVVDENDTWVAEPTDDKSLTLVTCYPFDAIIPGGRERYVVRATAYP